MKKFSFVLMLIVTTAFYGPANANFLVRQNLQEQINGSDLVIVGVGGSADSCDIEGWAYPCVKLTDLTIISNKSGNSPKNVNLILGVGISEMDVDCCEAGVKYLMILRKSKYGNYHPVNGPYSIIKLDEVVD